MARKTNDKGQPVSKSTRRARDLKREHTNGTPEKTAGDEVAAVRNKVAKKSRK